MKSFRQVVKITIFMTLSYFSAIDVYSQYFTLTQPNGKKFQVREVGFCCYLNFLETTDGYIVVRGPDKYYHYADYHQNKIFTASGLKVGIDSPKSVIRNIKDNPIIVEKIQAEADRYNAAVKENLKRFLEFQGKPVNYQPENYIGVENATTSTNLDMGIILVEFEDLTHWTGSSFGAYKKHHFENMAFSNDSYYGFSQHPDDEEVFGSIRDYYEVQSSGELDIGGEVVNPVVGGELRWIRLGNTSAYPPGSHGNAPTNLVVDAINAVFDSAASSSVWENKHANYEVTMIIVGGEDKDLYDVGIAWLQGSFGSQDFDQDFQYSNWFGATVFHERHGKRRGALPINFTHIGVWCHELGHLLGSQLMGGVYQHPSNDCQDWTVMRSGMRTGPLRKGACPANFDAPALVSFNWVTPTIIDNNLLNEPIQYINNKSQQRDFYQFNVHFNSNKFIIENRQYLDFNSYLPEYWESNNLGGLLVWRWETTRILLPADNDYDYIGPSQGDGDDPFPGRSVNNRAISMSTIPDTKVKYNLLPIGIFTRATGLAIKDISNSSNIMTADFYNNYWEGEIDYYDEVWSANRNPYYVGGNIFVTSGKSLTFGPGTIIDLNGNAIKTINGTLVRQDNVTFHPDIQLKEGTTLRGQYSYLWHALEDAPSSSNVIINSNISLDSFSNVPNGVTLTIKSNTTIDLNEYSIRTNGGTIDREEDVTIEPDIKLLNNGTTLIGQYSDIWQALEDVSSGDSIVVNSDISINSVATIPTGVTLTLKSGRTINLNEHSIRSDGGIINRETNVTVNPDIQLLNNGTTLIGQYSDIWQALEDVSSGDEIAVYSDISIDSVATVPSGVTLTLKSGTTINLNGNSLRTDGGTIDREADVTLNPDIQLLDDGTTLIGQYSHIQQAIDDASSGDNIYINQDLTVGSNATIPSGVTLSFKPGITIDLNGYNIETDGGTLDRDTNVTFIPDVRLIYVSYDEITGQYSDLQEALNDASSSEEIHIYSDVSINDNVSIPSNRRLEILPSNSLKFAYGKALNVYGEIYAVGQWNNRVVFTSIEPYTQWEGIKFYSNSYQYSYIYHCEISNANYGIYLDHHEPMETYRYNYIHHCNYGIFSRYSAPEIKDSYIQDNYLFGVYVMYGNPAFPSWHIRIAENDIRTTDEYDGIFLWESDAKIWADNDIFDNERYGVNAYTYSDVILVAASSGLNSIHYNQEGQLHFYDHSDGHVGHAGYYNTYGATNRILGNSYRVVAEASSDVDARRVW